MTTIPAVAETSPMEMGTDIGNLTIQVVSLDLVDEFTIEPEARIVAVVGFSLDALETLASCLAAHNRAIERSGKVPPFFVVVIQRGLLPELDLHQVIERLGQVGAGVVEISSHIQSDEDIAQELRAYFRPSGQWANEHFPTWIKASSIHAPLRPTRRRKVAFWPALVGISVSISLYIAASKNKIAHRLTSLNWL